MSLIFHQILVLKDNYVTLIHDTQTQRTALVDAGEAAPILQACRDHNWQLTDIWLTHHHGDHTGATAQLASQTGAKITGFAADTYRLPLLDHAVEEGEFSFGKHAIQVMHLPGHTHGHTVYYLPQHHRLFCGDVLFLLGCGRLFEGTPAQMYASLQRIKALPPQTLIHCGHEYTQQNGEFAQAYLPDNDALKARLKQIAALRAENRPTVPETLAVELATNPFLLAENCERFTQFREARNDWQKPLL